MPRKKYSPLKDIYLAGKLQGYALQLNTEALEAYLQSDPSDISYKKELRATIDYAKTMQQGNDHANIN